MLHHRKAHQCVHHPLLMRPSSIFNQGNRYIVSRSNRGMCKLLNRDISRSPWQIKAIRLHQHGIIRLNRPFSIQPDLYKLRPRLNRCMLHRRQGRFAMYKASRTILLKRP
jgi:hypothetical protein